VSGVATLPGIPGILTAEQLAVTAEHLAELQTSSGQVPWWPGGHCDPWNHIEVAMALTVSGRSAEARAAYRWLATKQLGDGSWFNYYVGDHVTNTRLDTNVCAYVATGVYHYLLVTGDADFAIEMWPIVDRALSFVLRWQGPDGTVKWSLDATGRTEGYALLTGSSSIFHALRCGAALAERLNKVRPEFELAAGRLGHAIAHHTGAFAPKNEYAMDWYYPVLVGALVGENALKRLRDGWETYVFEGFGVRCVSTSDWVTAAETAECVMALDAVGETTKALDLLELVQKHRRLDGSYFTGIAQPGNSTFPVGETTSYTAAAIILAVDALTSHSPAAALFRHEKLPPALDLAEWHCPLGMASECAPRSGLLS
jgi:hypothetical protein